MANERFIADLLHTLEKQMRKKLSEVSLDRAEIERLVSQMVGGAAGGGSAQLLESLGRIKEGTSQKDVIHTVLAEMSWHVRGCAIVILGGTSSFIWPGPGMGLPYGKKAGSVKQQVNLAGNSIIVRAATTGDVLQSPYPGTPTEAGIYRTLGVQPPAAFTCIPMSISGRVQAVVIADSESGAIGDTASLAIMVGLAGMIIETLPYRERIGFSQFPRLRTAPPSMAPATAVSDDVPFETAPPVVPARKPAAPVPVNKVPAPAPKAVAPPAPKPEPPQPSPRPQAKPAVRETPPPPPPVVVEEPAEPEEAEVAAGGSGLVDDYARELEMQIGIDDVESGAIEIEVSDEDLDAVRGELSSAAIPTPQEPAQEIETGPDPSALTLEPGEEAPEETVETGVEIEFLESPDEVIYGQTGAIDTSQDFLSLDTAPEVEVESVDEPTPPPLPVPPPIEPEPVEAPAAASIPTPLPVNVPPAREVRSETAELPGYNLDRFSGEERKQHEKAIRFARLLVSEIKLYNEEAVKQGRQFKDLAMRLREDIARSRALYDQRIPAPVRSQNDYFHGELVRQLADGDASLLG